MNKLKALFTKHKEIILYIIFGGLTTVVDWGVSFLCYAIWGEAIDARPLLIHVVDVAAWAAAVAFAFVTNRRLVFESSRHGFLPVLGELVTFAGGRVLTLLLQEALMFVFFTWLRFNKYAVKIGVAVLVVIVNYFISKLLVFRKNKKSPDESGQK